MPADQPITPKQNLRWYQYRLRSLFILTFLVAVASSWVAVTMRQTKTDGEFVSLANEQVLWKGYDFRHRFGPYLSRTDPSSLAEINDKIKEKAKRSDIFALVVVSNGSDQPILRSICALTKDKTWLMTEWSNMAYGDIKETTNQVAVPEDVLKRLSSVALYVDTDTYVYCEDGVDIFVYLNNHGRLSRFAIYHPGEIFPTETPKNNVTESLEQFLKSINVVEAGPNMVLKSRP